MLSETEIVELFSVIPETEARRAKAELQEQLFARVKEGETRVFWVDFDGRMKPTGAGIVDIGGLSTLRIDVNSDASNQYPEFNEILSTVESEEGRVGTVFSSKLKDRFLWFVPVVPTLDNAHSDIAMRALSVTYSVLIQLISTYNPEANLTRAESRAIVQIVAGLSVSESAAADGLQTETRRGQLKRAFAKLAVSGQSALVRKILSQAIRLLFIVDEEMRYSLRLSELVTTHLPKNVRLELRRDPNRAPMRVLEVGDPNGRPVVVVHGLFFVPFINSIAACERLSGIRFLIPLREGYVASPNHAHNLDDNDTRDKQSLRFLLESVKNEAPVLLGHSMGCVSAIRAANEHPDLVRDLCLVSPYFGRPAQGRAIYLSRIMKIVSRFHSDGIFYRIIAAQFAKRYSNPDNVRAALSRVFGYSSIDTEFMEQEDFFLSWFGHVFRNSVDGIAGEFRNLANFELAEISQVKNGCSVLIGNDDPLVEKREMVELLESCGHRVFSLDSAGHFAAMTSVDELHRVLETVLN